MRSQGAAVYHVVVTYYQVAPIVLGTKVASQIIVYDSWSVKLVWKLVAVIYDCSGVCRIVLRNSR